MLQPSQVAAELLYSVNKLFLLMFQFVIKCRTSRDQPTVGTWRDFGGWLPEDAQRVGDPDGVVAGKYFLLLAPWNGADQDSKLGEFHLPETDNREVFLVFGPLERLQDCWPRTITIDPPEVNANQ